MKYIVDRKARTLARVLAENVGGDKHPGLLRVFDTCGDPRIVRESDTVPIETSKSRLLQATFRMKGLTYGDLAWRQWGTYGDDPNNPYNCLCVMVGWAPISNPPPKHVIRILILSEDYSTTCLLRHIRKLKKTDQIPEWMIRKCAERLTCFEQRILERYLEARRKR